MINPLVILFPRLFGCRRATLNGLVGDPGLDRVVPLIEKLGGCKVGEASTAAEEVVNYYFEIDRKWVVLVVEEYKAIRLIAEQRVINAIEHALQTG